jgi:hypothetical protein
MNGSLEKGRSVVHYLLTQTRVARWYVFNPKIQIWVNFRGSCNGKCWYILWPFGISYSHMVYFIAIRYIGWLFGIVCTVLVCCGRKHLAALTQTRIHRMDSKHCLRNFHFRHLLFYGVTFGKKNPSPTSSWFASAGRNALTGNGYSSIFV